MALQNLWARFSRVDGKAMTKPFRRGLYSSVRLVVGNPIAPEQVTPQGLQAITADFAVGSGRSRGGRIWAAIGRGVKWWPTHYSRSYLRPSAWLGRSSHIPGVHPP